MNVLRHYICLPSNQHQMAPKVSWGCSTPSLLHKHAWHTVRMLKLWEVVGCGKNPSRIQNIHDPHKMLYLLQYLYVGCIGVKAQACLKLSVKRA